MGLFDYIQCDYPLPAHREMQERIFQTKSFDRFDGGNMDTYRISVDGLLLRMPMSDIRYGEVPQTFSGKVTFYAFIDDGDYGSGLVHFEAILKHGRLKQLTYTGTEYTGP